MEVSSALARASPQPADNNTESIAQAVTALLAPTIAASVEKAVQAGMTQFKKDLDDHAARPTETDLRLYNIEDEHYQAQATE